MPTFVFTGRDRDGRAVTGRRDAATAEAVAEALRRDGLVVTRLEMRRASARRPKRGVGARKLAAATRQLAAILAAGLPLVQALDLLARQAAPPRFAEVIRTLVHDVARGTALSEAMARHPQIFGSVYTSTVAAGERAGALAATLARVASHLERHAALLTRLRAALMYPAVVTGVTVVVVLLLVWKVVPVFASLFAGLDAPLPWPTRFVVAASTALVAIAPASVCSAALAVLGLRLTYRRPRGKLLLDRAILRIPGLGRLVRDAATAQCCRTLSTLVAAGVPLIEALNVAARTAGNRVVEMRLVAARSRTASGELLSDALGATGDWPPLMLQMVGIGETTGALDTMLDRAAETAEEALDRATQTIVTLAEPTLILVLGIVVGGLVVSLYLPLFELIGRLS
ncbi:MAG: type II secretion system F family protein [Luteitalea sp.]|nr:type II secretion system F family protein [Luteitalea sp.]